MIKKGYCRCGPHPLQVISSGARPYLLGERAALAPFPRISGVGRSGSWPPLHCGDSTNLAPEVVPGASLRSGALSPECGGHRGAGDGWAGSTCGSRVWGTIGADCSRVAGATTSGPPPQPHGWVGLGFGVSGFPHFWGGGHVPTFPGVWSLGLFSLTFFSTSLSKKGLLGLRVSISPLLALVSMELRSWGWVVDPFPGIRVRATYSTYEPSQTPTATLIRHFREQGQHF